jgi:hypothetical protein
MFSAVIKLQEAHAEFLKELEGRSERWDAQTGVVELMHGACL